MQVKNSNFGVQFKEIYRKGVYCGLCHETALTDLADLERSLLRSKKLRSMVASIINRSRPLGGYSVEEDLVAFFRRHGDFGKALWFEFGRGPLWSPVAWSLMNKILHDKGV